MGSKHPSYVPSPPIMMFPENLISSPSAVNRSLPRIISYLLLVELSTWHFHDTILVALNSGKQNSMFAFCEVVNFPAWVSHVVSVEFFGLNFYVSLPITVVELLPLSNRIRKSWNNYLPLQVFIQTCSIVE